MGFFHYDRPIGITNRQSPSASIGSKVSNSIRLNIPGSYKLIRSMHISLNIYPIIVARIAYRQIVCKYSIDSVNSINICSVDLQKISCNKVNIPITFQ